MQQMLRRSFEEEMVAAAERANAHKEHVRQQHDLLLRQWAMGEAVELHITRQELDARPKACSHRASSLGLSM